MCARFIVKYRLVTITQTVQYTREFICKWKSTFLRYSLLSIYRWMPVAENWGKYIHQSSLGWRRYELTGLTFVFPRIIRMTWCYYWQIVITCMITQHMYMNTCMYMYIYFLNKKITLMVNLCFILGTEERWRANDFNPC